MSDEELLDLNRRGFFPGPEESEEEFRGRVDGVVRAFAKENGIPVSHWDWVRHHLKELFDFAPECLPAYYSNRSLMPWQGAAAWIEEGGTCTIQLREKLRDGSYLGLYRREEVLSHEAVHAARGAFDEDRWEEFFACMASDSRWRRALGPIVQRPWEVWPFMALCLAGPFFPGAFLGAAAWAALGFFRLARGHKILRKAGDCLIKRVGDARKARAVLVRLTGSEIVALAKGKEIGGNNLRWRVIRLAYWKE